jgi:hypothetical protein
LDEKTLKETYGEAIVAIIPGLNLCNREITGMETLKKVIVRAHFIIGYNPPTDWIISNSLNL